MMLMTAHIDIADATHSADCSIRVVRNNINATVYIYYNYSTVVLTIYDLSCIRCITFISRDILDEI